MTGEYHPTDGEAARSTGKLELRADEHETDILVDANRYRREDVLGWVQSESYPYLEFTSWIGKSPRIAKEVYEVVEALKEWLKFRR